MLALVDKDPRGGEGGPVAVPAVYDGDGGGPGPALFTLEVDGELFAVHRAADGGTAYSWLSGPNEGYGFGESGPDRSLDEHREVIRVFLAQIDPATGFLEDD